FLAHGGLVPHLVLAGYSGARLGATAGLLVAFRLLHRGSRGVSVKNCLKPGLCWRLPWPTTLIALGSSLNLLNLPFRVQRPAKVWFQMEREMRFLRKTMLTLWPATAPDGCLPAHLL